jgi:hypothetical protein
MGAAEGGGVIKGWLNGFNKPKKPAADTVEDPIIARAKQEAASKEALAEIAKQRLEAQRIANKLEIQEEQMNQALFAIQEAAAKADLAWMKGGLGRILNQYNTQIEALLLEGRKRSLTLKHSDLDGGVAPEITDAMLRDGMPEASMAPDERFSALYKLAHEIAAFTSSVEKDKRTEKTRVETQIRELNAFRADKLRAPRIGDDGEEIVEPKQKAN